MVTRPAAGTQSDAQVETDPASATITNRRRHAAGSVAATAHPDPPNNHEGPAESIYAGSLRLTAPSAPSVSPPEPPQQAPTKLSGTTIAMTMTPLCLSATLSALDITIATPAIPDIVASFKSVSGYVWIGTAFILANTAVTPVWGSVADIWGRKPIILTAVSIFLTGSLLCALAPQMNALIAGRAVQGLGASGMSIMVNVVISDMFSLRDRGFYLAITSVVWAAATSVGPVIGGVFATRLDWRWCFWINLPIGAVVFAVLLFVLKVPNPHTPVMAGLKAIDWTGSFLIIGGILAFLLGLDFGGVVHPWSSATVICLLVFGALIVGIFIVNEWKFTSNPLIPLRLFSSSSAAAAYGVFACNSYVFIGLAYYLPLYSQSVLGADALTSGLHLLPLIVSSPLGAAFAGIYIQRTGKYLPVMYVAQVTMTLGVGLFIALKFEQNLTRLFIFEIITGFGSGLNIEAPIIAAQAATTVRDTAVVTATMSFLRSIATAVSVVIGGVLFQNEMNSANPRLVEKLGSAAAQFKGDEALANIEFIAALPQDQQAVVREAYFESLRTMWIMYVAFAGMGSILNLFVRAHHLRTEAEGAVLGVDREQRDQSPRQDNIGLVDIQQSEPRS